MCGNPQSILLWETQKITVKIWVQAYCNKFYLILIIWCITFKRHQSKSNMDLADASLLWRTSNYIFNLIHSCLIPTNSDRKLPQTTPGLGERLHKVSDPTICLVLYWQFSRAYSCRDWFVTCRKLHIWVWTKWQADCRHVLTSQNKIVCSLQNICLNYYYHYHHYCCCYHYNHHHSDNHQHHHHHHHRYH